MKRKLYVSIILVVIIFSGMVLYNFNKGVQGKETNKMVNNKVSEGYKINEIGKDSSIKGELVKDKEYKFHTFIQLGKRLPESASILELNFDTQIDYDKHSNKYVLKNTKLKIIPIGCKLYEKDQEFIEEGSYTGYYQFGVNPNQSFNETMEVGCAKLILDSKNAKVNFVDSIDSDIKINSPNSLKLATNNSNKVNMDFTILDQYYTMWYSIKLVPTAYNECVLSTF